MDVPSSNDMLSKVEAYRSLVLQYEQLNDEISALLMAHDGGTENMSEEDVQTYRNLARRRDETMNEMRWLEQELLEDE